MTQGWRINLNLEKLRAPITEAEVVWARRTAHRADWAFKRGKHRLKYRKIHQVMKAT